MSWVALAPAHERAGRLACACDVTATGAGREDLATTAAMFALTVLSQALSAATLPGAGLVLAPTPAFAAWPYALTLLGSALATLPAVALTDLFGKRAALALAASLGVAGGVLAARGYLEGHFLVLALGAFWLGMAQGFGFFYRHAPVPQARNRARTVAIILASGGLAALLAPGVVALAQSLAGPLAPAATLLAAGLAQVAALVLVLLGSTDSGLAAPSPAKPTQAASFVWATLAGAAAWFLMTALMARAAPTMALCGIGAAAASAMIASHILAMYAPAAILGPWAHRLHPGGLVAIGLLAASCGLVRTLLATTPLGFAAAMIVAGSGWALTMLGVSIAIHAQGAPSPRLLAAHDGALFFAAVAGALTANLWR